MLLRVVASLVFLTLSSLTAIADDWVAVKLRGSAESFVDKAWVPLNRGDVVSDDRLVRTLEDGRLDLQRNAEVITLGPNTQISIKDSREFRRTIVVQDFGTVEVEAEAKAVEHFTVQTKFMAAVVKGTHFIVTADELGASVAVTRGLVAVEAKETRRTTSVAAGYMASIDIAGSLHVSGDGPLPPIFDANGLKFPNAPAFRTGATAPGDATANGGADGGGRVDVASASGNLALDQRQPATTAAAQPSITDWMPTMIGVLAGILVGALALLFRRYFT